MTRWQRGDALSPRSAAGLAAVVALIAPRADAAAARAPEPDLAPTARSAQVAHVLAATAARSAPSGAARVRWAVPTQAPWAGGPVRLLILEGRRVGGRLWLRVRLPVRPNDASGWIPADRVRVETTAWRVRIDRATRRGAVERDGRTVLRFAVVVGAPATPTPAGRFAIAEEVRQADPRGFLGPWALHLTSHSDVLEDFGGGPGRVAIHGRDGASLADPLGSARSHGCIRVSDHVVRWLHQHLEAGTPVTVT